MQMRQYRSNQGRSPEKEESTYQTIKVAFIIFLLAIMIYSIFKIIINV